MTAETPPPLTRRRLLQSSAALGTLALAGCSGGGSSTPSVDPSQLNRSGQSGSGTNGSPDQTATETPQEYETVDSANPTVNVGQVVADDTLAFAVQSFSRQASIGEQSPREGREYALLQVAFRNRTAGEYLSFNNVRSHIVSSDGTQYNRLNFRGDLGAEAAREQLAPGELARSVLVYTVPTDVTDVTAFFEFFTPAVDYDTVTIDLSETSRPIATFDQNLNVPFNDVGETITDEGLSVTLEGVRTADTIEGAGPAGDQQEYVIPELTLENGSGSLVNVVFTEDAGLKDDNGNSFALSTNALTEMENPLPQSREVRGSETISGELAYVVPRGIRPLYFVFDFSFVVDGFRRFWQVR